MKLRWSGLFAVFSSGRFHTPAQQTAAPRPITVDDLFGVKEAMKRRSARTVQVIAFT